MRLLDVARVLRQDADSARAASHFLEVLRASPAPALEDVAAVAQRFARHARPPGPDLFREVSLHVDRSLRGGLASISGPTVAVLADAFAQARCENSVPTLRLACLGVQASSGIASQELLRFASACLELGAQDDPSIRSFIKLRLDAVADGMEPCDLAEAGRLMARARIYSASLSDAIDLTLTGNPWLFKQSDLISLLPHFDVWKLGTVQKKAFQRLALRLGEVTEMMTPAEALLAINVYSSVGSVNEVLMQHMHLRLLQDRAFAELPYDGIARLAASMSQVNYYHSGLLREIVAHIGEQPEVVAAWSEECLYGTLKSFGLAPVELPLPTVRMLGCRYNAIFAQGGGSTHIRNFFEVSAFFPELLRTVLERGGGRRLASLLRDSAAELGPRPCADAMLAIAAMMDMPPGALSNSQGCACTMPPVVAAALPHRDFRQEQPDWQMRVVIRPTRSYRQKDTPRQNWRQRGMHPELPHSKAVLKDLWLVGDDGSSAATALPSGSGRCEAPWVLTAGRRHSTAMHHGLAAPFELLQVVLPRLLAGIRDTGRDLAELPGAMGTTQFLEALAAGNSDEMPKLLPYGAGVELPPGALLTAGGGGGGTGDQASLAPLLMCGPVPKPAPRSTPVDMEVMRRSELVQICVQTLAALQLCLSPGAAAAKPALSLEMCRAMGHLAPLLRHILRPRRLEDEAIQRFNLGPLRMEAFVRRPHEPMVMEVYKTIYGIMPFVPKLTGWTLWEQRKDDVLEGERTGGAIVTVNREVEVPPFVICVVLRRKRPTSEREWGAGVNF